ncbi:MAG: hypothetical protein AAF773_18835 [Cyanobacteria bacterium P01_D01_bin.115]
MNTQLVNSIIQVIQALSTDEQRFVIATLNRQFQTAGTSNEPFIESGVVQSDANVSHADWALWQSLGDNAVPGILDNPSTQHDRYLYTDT